MEIQTLKQKKQLKLEVSSTARKRRRKLFGRNLELSSLALPGMLYIFIFSYVTMFGLIIAFKDYRYDRGIFGSAWVGLENFRFFFISNEVFVITRNTVLYNVGFIITTAIVAILAAIMLNELNAKLTRFYQTAMFLPTFASWIVVGYIVNAFLDSQQGYFNHFLSGFGVHPINWYFEAKYWPVILILVNLWKGIGFSTLVYYAGIVGIDRSYYEAAMIDGANRRQMATQITLPLLLPLIIILLILSLGNIFRADFGLFYFVPKDSSIIYSTTDVIDTYIYRALRTANDIGMTTAISLYQSVVGFILIVSANFIVRKINQENSLF